MLCFLTKFALVGIGFNCYLEGKQHAQSLLWLCKALDHQKQKQNTYVQAIDIHEQTCVIISESNVHITQFVRSR